MKQYELTVFLFVTSDNTFITGFFQLKSESPLLSKKVDKYVPTQHPAHQVNISRKEVLCAPDSSKFFGTPCIVSQLNRCLKFMALQSTVIFIHPE